MVIQEVICFEISERNQQHLIHKLFFWLEK